MEQEFVYVVVYRDEAVPDHLNGNSVPKIFRTLEGARKYYLDEIVLPFLRKPGVKKEEWFSFDLETATDRQWNHDIIRTFFQTATIEKVPFVV